MNSIISILIPCYNGEKYIDNCLQSCINQTYKNIEVIVINDGSTDNSLSILKKWAEKDNRIKIYNQENKGLGETRNILIQKANGTYFFFLDIDDLIASKFSIENLFKASNNEKANIVVGRTLALINKYYFPFFPSWWKVKNMSSEHYVKSNICTPWGQIIKTDFFKSLNISFLKNEVFEDVGVMPFVFLKGRENFIFIKDVVYKYRIDIKKDKLSSFFHEPNLKISSLYKQTYHLLSTLSSDESFKSDKYKRYINGILYQILNSIVFLSNNLNNKKLWSINQDVISIIPRYNLNKILSDFSYNKIKYSKTWWKSLSYFLLILWYRKIFKNFTDEKFNYDLTEFLNKFYIKKDDQLIMSCFQEQTNCSGDVIHIEIAQLDKFINNLKKEKKLKFLCIKINNNQDLKSFINNYYHQLINKKIILGAELNYEIEYETFLRYFSFVYSNDINTINYFFNQKLKTLILSEKIRDKRKINYHIKYENI